MENFRSNRPVEDSDKYRFYKRIYVAIILFRLTEELPIHSVTRIIGELTSGQLQSLQKESATFCSMTVTFCRKLNWNPLASCLETYVGRLGYGVRSELLPLIRIGTEVRK